MEEVREKLRGFLAKHVRNNNISDDEGIFSSGYVNSLFAMQLVLFIEKEFQVQLDDQDLALSNFETIAAIAGLVERKGYPRPEPAPTQ